MSDARAAGTIYDLGYQHYEGVRHGRGYAFRTLVWHSLRAAFGIGRSDRARSGPMIITLIVYLPAIIRIAIASAAGMPNLISYAGHLEFTGFLLALFAAGQAPELVVSDRQQGVLSLYLSRPLQARDYALAKLAALTLAMLVLTLGPLMLLFLGKIFISAAPWPAFKSEYGTLWPIAGGTLLTSVFFAAIGLALSSMASRRGYATAAVIAFFLLMPAASNMFRAVSTGDVKRYALLANPVWLMTGFANWLFDIQAQRRSAVGRADLPGSTYLYAMLIACVIATALLLRRYRSSAS